jgi:hypothetical protein
MLRILYDNKADTASVLTASTTSGALAASNLLTDYKTEVHRATATSVTYTLNWAAPVVVNAAILAFTNFTSTATMRARAYTNIADGSPATDSGTVLACAYQPFGLWDWGMLPLGVNAFSYGGFAYGRVYLPATSCQKLVIDVVDVDNTAAYVEAARLITGAYWEPGINPDFGPSIAPKSNTKHQRTDAGDLRTERRPVSRSLKLNLGMIAAGADRARVYDILRGNGMTKPVFLSLFPENAEPALEQAHQLWGKLNDSVVSHPTYGIFAAPLEIEEI